MGRDDDFLHSWEIEGLTRAEEKREWELWMSHPNIYNLNILTLNSNWIYIFKKCINLFFDIYR